MGCLLCSGLPMYIIYMCVCTHCFFSCTHILCRMPSPSFCPSYSYWQAAGGWLLTSPPQPEGHDAVDVCVQPYMGWRPVRMHFHRKCCKQPCASVLPNLCWHQWSTIGAGNDPRACMLHKTYTIYVLYVLHGAVIGTWNYCIYTLSCIFQ